MFYYIWTTVKDEEFGWLYTMSKVTEEHMKDFLETAKEKGHAILSLIACPSNANKEFRFRVM